MTLHELFLHRQFKNFNTFINFSVLKKLKIFIEHKTLKNFNFNLTHLRRILEFDHENINNFEERLNLISSFKRDGISKKSLYARYGKIEGDKKQKQITQKIASKTSKKGYIEKFGKIEGLKKYRDARCAVSRDIMIKRYGKEIGIEKWNKYLKKWKFSNSLEGYIEKYGKKIGTEKWANRYKNQSTLEKHIKLNGVEKGTEIFNKRMQKMWLRTSKNHFLEIHGKEKGEKLFNELKDNISLESKIKKYGNEKGKIIYDEYIQKLKIRAKELNFAEHFKTAQWYSKISQKLFWKILDIGKFEQKDMYFAENNGEWFIYDENRKNISKFDFKFENKIIEFNGDYWHRNPEFYSPVLEIQQRDKYKKKLAKKNNFEILIIWENDYNKDPKTIVEKCIQYLRN